MNLLRPEVWYGGYYELAIELGETSDERLVAALEAVWRQREVIGPSADMMGVLREDERQSSAAWLDRMHLHGEVHLPLGVAAPCGTCIVREEGGPDWLDFYLPLGGLSELVPEVGGYPVVDRPDEYAAWQRQLDEWLAGFGSRVYLNVPYRLALIGFEVSGECYAADVIATGVPAQRHFGMLWPERGKVSYYAPSTFGQERSGA